jgi:hypothetical protein
MSADARRKHERDDDIGADSAGDESAPAKEKSAYLKRFAALGF